MKSTACILLSALLSIVLLDTAWAEGQETRAGWKIPERTIPLPAASSMLKKKLASSPQPDISKVANVQPKTAEEWKQMVQARQDSRRAEVENFAHKLRVSIEKDSIEGVDVYRVTPKRTSKKHRKHVFLYLHGGAYVFNPGLSGLTEALLISGRIGIPVISVDYRMPPDHPFPAGLDDVVKVYGALLKKHPAATIAIGGTSAGGGLALATVLKLKQLSIDLPGAVYAGTPWADLTKTGDSYFINEGIDHVLISNDGLLESAARLYAGDADLKSPLVSPVYGDFSGFPPTILVSGTRDLFLSNVVRTHARMRKVGVVADLNVYEGFSHADYIFFAETPESAQVYRELGKFLTQHLK